MELAQEKTAPFTLGPRHPETSTAVLLVHGFTGSPWEMRPLGEALAARGFHVRGMRLPGHGTTPEAMLWVTWHDWVDSVQAELQALANYSTVLIAGMSMGGLLGMLMAAREPSRVHGLVLMAPAVKLKSRQGQALRLVRKVDLTGLLPQWVIKDSTDIEIPEVRAESPILPRYPVARLNDLFAVQDLAFDAESRLRCPSLVLAAHHDHVVDFAAVLAMQRRLPNSRLLVLNRGWHIIPRDSDRALAISEVSEFVDTVARYRQKVMRIPATQA
jgi:carboxylesterase